MIFASPLWLLALVLLPLAAGIELALARRDQARLARLVARPLWGRVVRRPWAPWRSVRLGLALLGAAGLVVALARPQYGMVREKVEREGVDVVLLLDTSASMATPDVAPNRFFLARQALLQLVSRLSGDRFALVAFEGEAYPLVPLTLDSDALALFLDTVEPGIVPAPGTSLGTGLAKGLDAFVDKERHNKVMVLVSDGEDLEGEVDAAVRRAREAGVVVDTVGVGTEAGQPVPELDPDGRVTGYKRDAQGQVVVSRLEMQNLEAIARGTGGQAFRITPQDTSLSRLAAAIEGMEQKTLAREFSYRRKEQFQIPLAFGLLCLTSALVLPLPRLRRPARAAAAARTEAVARVTAALLVLLLTSAAAPAQPAAPAQSTAPAPPAEATAARRGSLWDEILLRPRRETAKGRAEYERGNHPTALTAFERAEKARPLDPALRFNVADGLYKKGLYDEAATLFRALGADARAPLAAPARYNLGNSLYQKQDYRGAVRAYRDALELAPGDGDARRNLELALRALKEQEEQQKRQQQGQDQKDRPQDQKSDQQKQGQKDAKQDQQQRDQDRQKQQGQDQKQQGQDQRGQQNQKQQGPPQQPRPQTPQERADQRFRQEAGMPQERAMQLLDALQQNEKAEQKKLLAAKRAQKRKGKDW